MIGYPAFAEHKGGPVPWRDWHAQVQKLLDEAEIPPHPASDKLPHANRVTYATVFRNDRIAEDRRVADMTIFLDDRVGAGEPVHDAAVLDIRTGAQFEPAEIAT